MSKNTFSQIPILYRPYDFPSLFPVLSFFGQNWIVSMHKPEFLHFHNCFELGRCLTGKGTVCFRDYELPFEAGQFSFINPLEPHISVCSGEPSRWEYVFFDPTILFSSTPDAASVYQDFYLSQKPSRIIGPDTSPFLYHLLEDIYLEFRQKQTFYSNMLHSLFLVLLSELNRLPDSIVKEEDARITPVRTALLHIYSHYAEPLTVSGLAGLCCLSESHFRRIFKEIIGISPLEYLQHYRIQHACHLILQDRIPLNETAKQVGYQTLSSFNRQFRQYTGLSPSAWKKEYLHIPISNNIRSLEDSDTQEIFRY